MRLLGGHPVAHSSQKCVLLHLSAAGICTIDQERAIPGKSSTEQHNRRQGTHELAETAVVYASQETSHLLDRPPRHCICRGTEGIEGLGQNAQFRDNR